MNAHHPEVTTPNLTSANHLAAVSDVNKNLMMNEWLINELPKTVSLFGSITLPTSAAGLPRNDKVQRILLTTASILAKGNQNAGHFPHKYVRRRPEQQRASLNSLTINEHLFGIMSMIRDQSVPAAIKPYLYSHMEELVIDSRDYE